MKIIVRCVLDPASFAAPRKRQAVIEMPEYGETVTLEVGQEVELEVDSQITGNESVVGLAPDTRSEVTYEVGDVHQVGARPEPVREPDDSDEPSTSVRLYPQTAREALLEIRRRAAEVHVDVDVTDFGEAIDRVALEGLVRTEPINFELSDQLADRLAEAHYVLAKVIVSGAMRVISSELKGEINATLTLPPDLETMVERRRR